MINLYEKNISPP